MPRSYRSVCSLVTSTGDATKERLASLVPREEVLGSAVWMGSARGRVADRGLRVTQLVCLAWSLGGVGCNTERLVKTGEPGLQVLDDACDDASDCPPGEVCVFGECVPAEELACEDEQIPLIHVTPLDVSFGEVSVGTSQQLVVTVANVGPCLLTVAAVDLSDSSSDDFGCSPCDFTAYPKRLVPEESMDITLRYSPTGIGPATGTLLIQSDDPTVGDGGVVTVYLSAQYSGTAVLVLDPPELSFGYVPYDPADATAERTETLRIMNRGTGNAALLVEFIYVTPGADFSIPEDFSHISPAAPVLLPPLSETDPETWIDVPVTFRPTRFANQESMLTVHAGAGGAEASVDVSARLSGSSVGPPSVAVVPHELVFSTPSGDPLPLGMTLFRQVYVSNTGASELFVELGLDDSSGDFALSPSHLVPIPPGGTAAVGVSYTPTAASDLAYPSDPRQALVAYLRVVTNDPQNVLTTVILSGWARAGVTDDVLKLEMTFDNDESSWSGSDFRDADLELESPLGMACRKPSITYAAGADGTYVPVTDRDFCAEWNATGLEGHVSWIPGGIYEEPERIILFGLDPDQATGGELVVRAHYREDCANMPSGILADILGIGTGALAAILGGAAGVPIPIDPQAVRDLVAQNCWQHASTLVTVKVFVSGQEIAAPQVQLRRKGDFADVLKLRRQGGTFVVAE